MRPPGYQQSSVVGSQAAGPVAHAAAVQPTEPARRDGTLIGYADPLVARPRDRVRFKVSAEVESYAAEVVRVIHGDEDPQGPGFKEVRVETSVTGEYPGKRKTIHAGSYVMVPHSNLFDLRAGLTLQAWVYPTTPRAGRPQGV